MLTFEYDTGGAIEITFDDDGRSALLRLIGQIPVGDHDHLMTPSWGGTELSEDFPNPDLIPVHQVNVQFLEVERAKSA